MGKHVERFALNLTTFKPLLFLVCQLNFQWRKRREGVKPIFPEKTAHKKLLKMPNTKVTHMYNATETRTGTPAFWTDTGADLAQLVARWFHCPA